MAESQNSITTRPTSLALAAVGKWTRTGLVLPSHLPYDEWASLGHVLSTIHGASSWWVGDWIRYGDHEYGEKYTQAVDEAGFEYQSSRDAVYVASSFQLSRRRDNLSFSHHRVVAAFPAKQADQILARAERERWSTRDLRAYLRELRHAARTIDREWPTGRYGVILCDPPWQPDVGLLDPTRVIENQYPTMTVEQLCDLGETVKGLSASDCVLLMWVVTPKVREAMQVMDAWGFTHKSGAVWVKDTIGMGYWFRSRHELLFLGTTGKPATPLEDTRADSVMQAPRRGHSQKPDEQYALIEAMFPGVPKIELFARPCSARPTAWATWGNEAV